jgi:hypothetical protein
VAPTWRLREQPDLSSLPSPLTAVYRVTVDGSGRVLSLSKLSSSVEPPSRSLEAVLRRLVFEPVPGLPAASEVEVRVSKR